MSTVWLTPVTKGSCETYLIGVLELNNFFGFVGPEKDALKTVVQAIAFVDQQLHQGPQLGFAEKVYEKLLVKELQIRGLDAMTQQSLKVCVRTSSGEDHHVTTLRTDITLPSLNWVLELKSLKTSVDSYTTSAKQIAQYVKLSKSRLGMLVNFGISPPQMSYFE